MLIKSITRAGNPHLFSLPPLRYGCMVPRRDNTHSGTESIHPALELCKTAGGAEGVPQINTCIYQGAWLGSPSLPCISTTSSPKDCIWPQSVFFCRGQPPLQQRPMGASWAYSSPAQDLAGETGQPQRCWQEEGAVSWSLS